MGNWYPYWTKCCTNTSLWFSNASAMGTITWAAAIGGIIGGATWIWFAFIPGADIFLAACCGAGIAYCNWWLHIRLICLGGNVSVIGAVFNVDAQTPSDAFWNLGDYDTDYCFNLLLWGATPTDVLPNHFVLQFFPPTAPQPWGSAPTGQYHDYWIDLQGQAHTRYPNTTWHDINLILPQTSMGVLGLGYTGQSYSTPPALGPLQSITINPPALSVPNSSVIQFQAIGFDPSNQSNDITTSVDWSTSGFNASMASNPGSSDKVTGVLTAASSGSGTTTIRALDPGSGVKGVTNFVTTAGGNAVQTGVDPVQQMLLHCEIEGQGMDDFRTLLYWMLGLFVTSAVLSTVPVFGWIISLVLFLIALLVLLFGGAAAQHDLASPQGSTNHGKDGWGGYSFATAPTGDSMVDIVYVYGRWVFDSLHQPAGSNEIHPVMWVNRVTQVSKTDLSYGNWPSLPIDDVKAKFDTYYAQILAPSTKTIQSAPEFKFTIHPVIDGCQGSTSYAPPAVPPAPK